MNYNSKLAKARYEILSYPQYLELAKEETLGEADLQDLRIVVFRSCTLEPMEPIAKVELAFEGFLARMHFMGFNSFEQDLLNEKGGLGEKKPDVALFFLTLQEFLPDFITHFQNFSPQEIEEPGSPNHHHSPKSPVVSTAAL